MQILLIGGCDKNGNIVYNDISRMIINSYKNIILQIRNTGENIGKASG